MTTTLVLVELPDTVNDGQSLLLDFGHSRSSALRRVFEAKAIGSSLPQGSTCEMTVPMPYGDASVESTIGFSGSKCTRRDLSASICFS